jgi:CBS domain-containing protein
MIGRICTRVVVTATPDESVLSVTRRMAEHDVGAVVVVSAAGMPLGIVTDRDIVLRVVAGALAPAGTPVSMVMSRALRTVDESLPIEQALGTMASARIRRLVVTGEGGALRGIVSMDDVLELLAEEAASVRKVLRGPVGQPIAAD